MITHFNITLKHTCQHIHVHIQTLKLIITAQLWHEHKLVQTALLSPNVILALSFHLSRLQSLDGVVL